MHESSEKKYNWSAYDKLAVLCIILLLIVLIFVLNTRSNKKVEEVHKFDKELSVTFLDVGQGDATFLEFPNGENMLVDCSKDAVVIEALGRAMKFSDKTINYLVVSHPDLDHYGGCIDVLRRFNVKQIIYNGYEKKSSKLWQAFMREIENEMVQGAKYIHASTTLDYNFDEVKVSSLYPNHDISKDAKIPGSKNDDSNNTSIILKVSHGTQDMLLTADAEKELEAYLVEEYGDELDVEVLKLGHHGSNTSSILDFLEFVTPEYVVNSSGLGNQFGHPSQRIIKRVERFGPTIYRTDLHGDITLTTNGDKIVVSTQK
jgi:competence protein ComEC